MSSMQIDLYDALTGANIPTDKAKAVVESLGETIDMQVNRANETIVVKLDGMQAKLEGMQAMLSAQIDALVHGRIDPLQQSVTQLANRDELREQFREQFRVHRIRWVVGTALTMTGIISAVAGTLHALHVF